MEPPSWQPPPSFDGYRLVRLLGKGAMGGVFLAQDTLLDRLVAVKFIASIAPDEAQRERFRTEARAIARVQHPNVVGIYRVGDVQGHPYLASEFIRGESLDRLQKPLPWRRVLDIGIGLARGLSAAHRRGVLHRDIKPANALLTEEGQVKLLDFGVAKLLDVAGGTASLPLEMDGARDSGTEPSEETIDQVRRDATADASTPQEDGPAGVVAVRMRTGRIGTPQYMAPEVWRGEPATESSDLYSLGVVLYELCSGRMPEAEQLRQDPRGAPPPQQGIHLLQMAPQVEPAFAALILRCLEPAPAKRFPSAEALREALEAIQESAHEEADLPERPYPGSQVFTARERSAFFGRAAQVRTVLERLRAESLVVVAGEPGVGKSSLCRAGVLPRVGEGALGLGGAWDAAELLPGKRPLQSLALALAPLLGRDKVELLRELRQAPEELGRQVRALGSARGLLVFVDQLEELVTLAEPDEVERFALALGTLASNGPRLRVLATANDDFLARLAWLPGLGEHLSRGKYLLPHLSEAGLREAIVSPARAQGFAFESETLVDTLVAAGRAGGGLLLLQLTLAELWERRDRQRRVIPAEALVAMGGVEGALARHADGVLKGLQPGQRAEARRLLLKLVLAKKTPAQRTQAELLGEAPEAEMLEVLWALARGRLVRAREAMEIKGITYELAYEVLPQGWNTLRTWLAGGEEQQALRHLLKRASEEWQQLGRASELLWSGRQLAAATQLVEEGLSALEMEFFQASLRVDSRKRLGRTAAAVEVLESALLSGSNHPEVRRQFAEVLYRHIRLAERDHQPQLRTLLLRGLEQMDDDGVYRRRLVKSAPPEEGSEPAEEEAREPLKDAE